MRHGNPCCLEIEERRDEMEETVQVLSMTEADIAALSRAQLKELALKIEFWSFHGDCWADGVRELFVSIKDSVNRRLRSEEATL